MTVETCPCDTCVYKTIAAKLCYLMAKKESEGGQAGGWCPTEAELEQSAAERLSLLVEHERVGRVTEP